MQGIVQSLVAYGTFSCITCRLSLRRPPCEKQGKYKITHSTDGETDAGGCFLQGDWISSVSFS